MQRQPKTVYFQHFQSLGLYLVFDRQDVQICRAVLKRMVHNEETFGDAKSQLEQAGFRVEMAPAGLEREVTIENWRPRTRRAPDAPLTPSFF